MRGGRYLTMRSDELWVKVLRKVSIITPVGPEGPSNPLMKPERKLEDNLAPPDRVGCSAFVAWSPCPLVVCWVLALVLTGNVAAQVVLSKDIRRPMDFPAEAELSFSENGQSPPVAVTEQSDSIAQQWIESAAAQPSEERVRPVFEWARDQVGFSRQESWAVDRMQRGNRMSSYADGDRPIHETEWLKMIPVRKGYLADEKQVAMQVRTLDDLVVDRPEIPEEIWAMIHRVIEPEPEVVPDLEPAEIETVTEEPADGMTAEERAAQAAAYSELMRMFDLDSFKVPERVVPSTEIRENQTDSGMYVPFVLPSSEAPLMIREGSQAGFEIRKN